MKYNLVILKVFYLFWNIPTFYTSLHCPTPIRSPKSKSFRNKIVHTKSTYINLMFCANLVLKH